MPAQTVKSWGGFFFADMLSWGHRPGNEVKKMDKQKALTWARSGWSKANAVLDDPTATANEKQLAQSLAEVAYAVVELADGNR